MALNNHLLFNTVSATCDSEVVFSQGHETEKKSCSSAATDKKGGKVVFNSLEFNTICCHNIAILNRLVHSADIIEKIEVKI